jgi:Kef-type K+ transport system membrane component KefB/Trk K+ transport system NAD-binding subunit
LSPSPFFEFSAILVLVSLLGIVGRFLRQPLIVSFLAAGVLAGPFGLGLISSYSEIELLAHMGIALLLFIVGLKLDLGLIKSTGLPALLAGTAQMLLTGVLGAALALAFGLDLQNAVFVGVALAFSSTIIVVKLLSDKGEIDSLHGRIAVGILIVQDVAAILALVALSTFAGGSGAEAGQSTLSLSLQVAGRGLALLLGLGLLTRYGLPALLRSLADSQEMLLVFSISWAIFMGALSEALGFSKEVGAFLAGVSLASTPYRDAIGARLAGLRDFLLLFFFIDLGARMDIGNAESQLLPALALSAVVLVVKPLSVMIFTGLLGYGRRVGFLAGTSLAQVSEFSLILIALGVSLGQVDRGTLGLVTLTGVITVLISSYFILYSDRLYGWAAPYIKIFQRRRLSPRASLDSSTANPEYLLLGLGNYGSGIAESLLERGKGVAGVDFDPEVLERWRGKGLRVIYGDASDPELHAHLPLAGVQWVVGSFRNLHLNLALLGFLRQAGYQGKVALAASSQAEALLLGQAGAQVVLRPFQDAAEQAADALAHVVGAMPQTDWPLAFRELKLKTGARYAGKTLRDIPLRQNTGVSIVAVSRAGQVHQDPGPEFLLMPGDRVVLVGPPQELDVAEDMLHQVREGAGRDRSDPFAVAEVQVPQGCTWAGATLSDLAFRAQYGATVLGIIRGHDLVPGHKAAEVLQVSDRILVFGKVQDLERIQELAASPQSPQPQA